MYSHTKNYIDSDSSLEYLSILYNHVPWRKMRYSPNSRLIAHWNGDTNNLGYKIIHSLVNKLEKDRKVKVQGVFLNLYKDGSDHCPYHKDRYGTDVYTISLGETRDLLIKKDGVGTRAEKFTLESGDLYYMAEELHKDHKHSVPKRKNVNGPRISIVFFAR